MDHRSSVCTQLLFGISSPADSPWFEYYRPLLPILIYNVTLNNLESTVSVAELNWYLIVLTPSESIGQLTHLWHRGTPPPMKIPRPNIILAADCVYFEPAFPLLVQTLDDLSDSATEILFCYKKRRKVYTPTSQCHFQNLMMFSRPTNGFSVF